MKVLTELLWTTEDDLRALCRELWIRLCVSEAMTEQVAQEAMENGYREGYARAVIQISSQAQVGDAKSHLLH